MISITTVTVVIGFVASLPGCASVGPIAPVVVSDVKSVPGTWQSVVYEPGSEPDYVELTIREDGGHLIMEGERGRGVGTLMRQQHSVGKALAQQLARRALPTDSYAASHPLSAKGSE